MKSPRVILLAAGQGSRLGELTRDCHKALLPVGGQPLLARTARQLQAQGLSDIVVVVGHRASDIRQALAGLPAVEFRENPRYASDTNIGSLLLGLEGSAGPALVVEADVAFDDQAAAEIATACRAGDSIWFTQGRFSAPQIGGILRADPAGSITDLRYVPRFAERFRRHRKLLGLLAIGTRERPLFHQLLREAAAQSVAQYYMAPWAAHLAELPCSAYDLAHRRVATYNTPEEYGRCRELFGEAGSPAVEMIDVASLKHIEGFSPRRVSWLEKKIRAEGVWKVPVVVDRVHHCVMDGQHRMEVARRLGLAVVPALRYDYREVEVWSLRPRQYTVSPDEIVRRSLQGDLYPYKTAKHRFPCGPLPALSIPLEQLS